MLEASEVKIEAERPYNVALGIADYRGHALNNPAIVGLRDVIGESVVFKPRGSKNHRHITNPLPDFSVGYLPVAYMHH